MLRTQEYRWGFSDGEENLPNMCKGWLVLYMILNNLFRSTAVEVLRAVVKCTTGWRPAFEAKKFSYKLEIKPEKQPAEKAKSTPQPPGIETHQKHLADHEIVVEVLKQHST